MPSASKINIPKTARNQDAAYLEADILTNLRLAAEFSRLAESHGALFDENGFRYCVDRFLEHARLVSTGIKKLREVK
jgi:hypothetical protein